MTILKQFLHDYGKALEIKIMLLTVLERPQMDMLTSAMVLSLIAEK